MAFSTKALTLEQWMWCLFFGVGTLLWGQVVTTIPTRKIPKILSWGRGQPDDIGAINLGDEKFDPDSDKKPRKGQILWLRGLTRLQTQTSNRTLVQNVSVKGRSPSQDYYMLRVIRAFKSTLEDLEERRSVHSLHSLHSMRSSRSHTGPRPFSDFTYIDEDPTNTAVIGIGRLPAKGADTANTATAIANTVADHAAARINSNSAVSTSPLLLTISGPGNNAYNHHNTIHNTTTTTTATTTTTNDNRSSSNSANPSQTNHTQMPSSNSRDNTTTITGNSPLLSSNNLALPELTKLVHETSI